MFKYLEKALRIGEGKKFRELLEIVEEVGKLEEEISSLSDEALASKTDEFRKRLSQGETLDDILPEAFAVVREVAKRAINMRHFDVQITGGVVLHQGKIAEMKTGEGKTLVAVLPAYLNTLEGKGVHIVTVNDYLAKRDREWMGPIYEFLGLNLGLLQNFMGTEERRAAYQADITYGTNTEFGFDYLRDNMVINKEEMVQRGHHYAIVDEVDSILIDEARTPLIISGAPEESAALYRQFVRITPRLRINEDYEIEEKTRTVGITEKGIAKVEQVLGIDNLYDHVNTMLVHHLTQALRAKDLFKKDVDYIIKDSEVIIVDEFTGRLMIGRRYSEGLHQAIEAKEGVPIREESQTLATVTLQNYFRMYEKLAGMTGTAATEADEFMHTYKLETVVTPTNEPMIRADMPDLIYKTEDQKFKSAAEDIIERHTKGQPVLVGTISIEKSERLSQMLKRRGIKHEVLNAKHHEREAHIISKAGEPGAVTIATNMAGRGVDIVLGEGVVEKGGLHVLGTERHDARRIDNQLRGRSGRQGDPGSSQFYLSLEDDLMRLFASERISSIMERVGFPDDIPIENRLITRAIESAQKKVEVMNFGTRKHLLEYDDVMNKQREVIYEERKKIIEGEDLKEEIEELIEDVIWGTLEQYTDKKSYPEDWDLDGLFKHLYQFFPLSITKEQLELRGLSQEKLAEELIEDAREKYEKREKEFGSEMMQELERMVMLNVVDNKWRELLYELDYLKEGIGLRAIGQKDPLVEYKSESYEMFQQTIQSIKDDFLRYIYHVQVVKEEPVRPRPVLVSSSGAPKSGSAKHPKKGRKIGRNEPCPCGSGKKYKKCHGA